MIVHEFEHMHDVIDIGSNKGLRYPLWLIAQDPFSDVESEADGYVVHLDFPRFTARYYIGDKPLNPADTLHGLTYCHPDLDINLCELVFTEDDEQKAMTDIEKWLHEACMAIGHYLGNVAFPEDKKQ